MIKKVLVARQPSAPDWTLSEFYFDGIKKGVGVEDEYRAVKVKGETRVPEGSYPLGMRVSPKFSSSYYRDDEGNLISAKDRISTAQRTKYHTQHEMIWVQNVPNFDFILLHWGNTDDDTDGCYCVGSTFAPFGVQKGVAGSRAKYMEIYPELWRAVKAGGVSIQYK